MKLKQLHHVVVLRFAKMINNTSKSSKFRARRWVHTMSKKFLRFIMTCSASSTRHSVIFWHILSISFAFGLSKRFLLWA